MVNGEGIEWFPVHKNIELASAAFLASVEKETPKGEPTSSNSGIIAWMALKGASHVSLG
ncbi:uncharacterized protein VDAG_00340 [Verticillium dahliae VdLs.17]|uniref:Uncharacterized protein n=1 Tax=Verticillium dahliae (strain VdLs.17 / ATCC MYA-4575 / FGSC 10137) TaxID=498257 RepID=G2WS07_VERDV|nr:uncharacterized protein VDAG_00340 [Verticillium dahliae VdLs.17]EGY13658.1 hypothetical protein VDAG_00340 [Verticillium dahliae VdLs.17]